MNEDSKNIAIIGDRIFTDVIVGNRCNIQTILVKRLSKNGLPMNINLTLILEKMISNFLKWLEISTAFIENIIVARFVPSEADTSMSRERSMPESLWNFAVINESE